MPTRLILVIGFPQSKDARRAREYDLCLARNVSNRNIDRIVVVREEDGERSIDRWRGEAKVEIHDALRRRGTYGDLIEISNRYEGDVVVLSNADIHFDWSIAKLKHTPGRSVMAITRADSIRNLYSTDAWCFRPVMPLSGCSWHLGRMHCENAFLDQVKKQLGWPIFNPCFEVRLAHVHGSQVRSSGYSNCVKVDKFVTPRVVLFDAPSTFREV